MKVVGATNGLDVLNTAIPWLTLLLLIGLSITSPGKKIWATIASKLRTVKVGTVNVELSPEARTVAKATLEETFSVYRMQIASEIQQQVGKYKVESLASSIYDGAVRPYLEQRGKSDKEVRLTVYIPDVLFDGGLLQLIGYRPEGGGAGRRFDHRFGILGRAWRLEKPQVEKEVPQKQDDLIKSWGMTKAQARERHERQSFACVPLFSHNELVGAIYMDAPQKDTFEEAGLVAAIDACAETDDLASALLDVVTYMRVRSPQLEIYG